MFSREGLTGERATVEGLVGTVTSCARDHEGKKLLGTEGVLKFPVEEQNLHEEEAAVDEETPQGLRMDARALVHSQNPADCDLTGGSAQ